MRTSEWGYRVQARRLLHDAHRINRSLQRTPGLLRNSPVSRGYAPMHTDVHHETRGNYAIETHAVSALALKLCMGLV